MYDINETQRTQAHVMYRQMITYTQKIFSVAMHATHTNNERLLLASNKYFSYCACMHNHSQV